MIDVTGESPAQIIGAITGGVGGYALGTLIANELKLKGAKRKALIAAATLGGAALGAFLGPYAAKLGKKVMAAVKTYGKKVVCKVTKKGCFVAGTKVMTENGDVPIEDIKEGDLVYAENPETGERGLRKVVQTYINKSEELVHVFVNEEEIKATPEHPFYVQKKGWVPAVELRAGDILVLQSGEYVVVELIQHEILEAPIEVYNFEVEEFHTYYVGNILVHNMCYLRGNEAVKAAKKLGYEPTNYYSKGQRIFYNSKKGTYITTDIDSHNGGIWKMAKSVKGLSNRTTRLGTYDAVLKRIGD